MLPRQQRSNRASSGTNKVCHPIYDLDHVSCNAVLGHTNSRKVNVPALGILQRGDSLSFLEFCFLVLNVLFPAR